MDENKLEPTAPREDPLSLEEILKFCESIQPAASGEPEEDVQIWNGGTPAQTSVRVPGDTVRMEPIGRESVEEEASGDTVKFTPAGEFKQEEPPFVPPVVEKPEPYSENWEPEYEQPMGEYVPQEPIVFRPKSRLWELKKKLVEGPERRYYELAEQGLGKLQWAIFMNLIVCLLAAGTTALYALGMVGENRLKLLIFGQFLLLLLSALFGSYQLMEGVGDLFRGRFSLNTLLTFSFLGCCADAILCLQQQRVPCCAAFSLNMTMSLWSAYQKRNTEMGQMDTMRKATRLDSVVSVPGYFEGRPGFLKGEGQVEDFMDTYNHRSGGEKTLSVYALIALFVSLGAGVTGGVLHSLGLGIQIFCASLLVATPATMFITLSRPMALLERRLHKFGAVLCGWQGVRSLCKNGSFPLTDTDLFPLGSAKMNGVKFYGSRQPDQVVAYGAALITADGGTMAPLFSQLLESRSGYHYDATGIRSYPGGIGGEVDGEAVLAGTLSFMQSMGVDMPEGTRVNSAVYVAIDGELSGVFAISYAKVKDSAMGLTTLCAYRGLTPVMTTGDFMLTDGFIRSKFGVNVRRIAFPARDVRAELEAMELPEEAVALALTTRDGLAGRAYAVTGARSLRSASVVGVTIHMIGGILGLLSMIALAVLGAGNLVTSANILLFELIWMIPGLLVTEWTRSV